MAGVYIHIPFCRRICSYCDFYHSASLQKSDALLASLQSEILQRKDFFVGKSPKTLYLGGGTPSLLSADSVAQLYQLVKRVFNVESFEEFTLEANPEDLNEEYLLALKKCGVNRLSIGIQSLYDDILKFMNRSHSGDDALEVVKRAQRVGFENISVDIIFGVPHLSTDMLQEQLRRIIELNVTHISAYHLTIDHGSILYKRMKRGEFKQIEESLSMEQYKVVDKTLTCAGYEHYEVSNYALPNHRAIHNSAYWSGEPYIGIGPSAHSFDGESRHANIASVNGYIDAINSGEPFSQIEELSVKDRANEYIMTSLRRAEGVKLECFVQLFGEERTNLLISTARKLTLLGTLQMDENRLYIDSKDFLISDYIISELFEV